MIETKTIGLLDSVMAKPSMYVGAAHLDRFECFVIGYICGCNFLAKLNQQNGFWEANNDRKDWYEFTDWVIHKHYRLKHSAIGCCGEIAINGKFGWKKRGMKELIRLWNEYKCKK